MLVGFLAVVVAAVPFFFRDSPFFGQALGCSLLLILETALCYNYLQDLLREEGSLFSNLRERFNGVFGELSSRSVTEINNRKYILSRYERENPLQNLKVPKDRERLESLLYRSLRDLDRTQATSFIRESNLKNKQKSDRLAALIQFFKGIFEIERAGYYELAGIAQKWPRRLKGGEPAVVSAGREYELVQKHFRELNLLEPSNSSVVFPEVGQVCEALAEVMISSGGRAKEIKEQCVALLQLIINERNSTEEGISGELRRTKEERLRLRKENYSLGITVTQLQQKARQIREKLRLIHPQNINEAITVEFELKSVQQQILHAQSRLEWVERRIADFDHRTFLGFRRLTSHVLRLEAAAEHNVKTSLSALAGVKHSVIRRAVKALHKLIRFEPREDSGPVRNNPEQAQALLDLLRSFKTNRVGTFEKARQWINEPEHEQFRKQSNAAAQLERLYEEEIKCWGDAEQQLGKCADRGSREVQVFGLLGILGLFKKKAELLEGIERQIAEHRTFAFEEAERQEEEEELHYIESMMAAIRRSGNEEDPVARQIINQFLKVIFKEWNESEVFKQFFQEKLHTVLNKRRPGCLEEIVVEEVVTRGGPELLGLRCLKSEYYQSLFELHLRFQGLAYLRLGTSFIVGDTLHPFKLAGRIDSFEAKVMLCFGPRFLGKSWISFSAIPAISVNLQPHSGKLFWFLRLCPFVESALKFLVTQLFKKLLIYPRRMSLVLPMEKISKKPALIRERLERERRERAQRSKQEINFKKHFYQ